MKLSDIDFEALEQTQDFLRELRKVGVIDVDYDRVLMDTSAWEQLKRNNAIEEFNVEVVGFNIHTSFKIKNILFKAVI